MEGVLSTKQVASLLDVTETTIKRWADDGNLRCTKTLGGHRKFLIKDLVEFGERNSFTIFGPPVMAAGHERGDELAFDVASGNPERLAGRFLGLALDADREGMLELLMLLYSREQQVAGVVDATIAPALSRISEMWRAGTITIDREHRATAAITETLIRWAPELHRRPSNGLSAFCACPEGEFHDVGLRCLAYALEADGWHVHYIGPNTPVDTLISFAGRMNPHLGSVSLTIPADDRKYHREIQKLGMALRGMQSRLLVGGIGASRFTPEDLACDHISWTITDAIAYTRTAFPFRSYALKEPDAAAIQR